MYTDKQLREIFHLLFLERLFRVGELSQFSIKGGVNLRFFFKSPRYSEDMDIDVFSGSVTTLKKNSYGILADKSFQRVLATYGIEELKINNPESAKQTETTQRFKVRLVNGGVEYPTKVEFSRRKTAQTVALDQIDPEVIATYKRPNFHCPHYNGEDAVKQKVAALAGRTESQARDVFDLGLLLSGHVPHFKAKGLPDLGTAIEKLLTIEYDDYKGQVVEYLSDDYKKTYGNKKYWIEITTNLLEWLEHGKTGSAKT